MMGEHDGHRERLKRRFITEGLGNFEAHNVLELLLFYSVPRKDTNSIAHRLIEQFGSLVGVLNASPEELTQVEGITMSSAVHLHLIAEVARRYYTEALAAPPAEADCGDKMLHYGRKLVASCAGLTEEHFFVICLDNSMRELCFEQIGNSGSPTAVPLATRKVAELAMKYHAPAIIIAHNHPNGLAIPSREDIGATLSLKKTLSALDIRLLDHFIIAGDDFVSMAQSGYFSESYLYRSSLRCEGAPYGDLEEEDTE